MKSILDKSFRYVPARLTDVAATFRRIRKALSEEARARAENETEAQAKTVPIKRAKS